MKTVWLKVDERGEVVWHPVFLDFARYWGFRESASLNEPPEYLLCPMQLTRPQPSIPFAE
jgi:hypothetical protein